MQMDENQLVVRIYMIVFANTAGQILTNVALCSYSQGAIPNPAQLRGGEGWRMMLLCDGGEGRRLFSDNRRLLLFKRSLLIFVRSLLLTDRSLRL